MKNNSVSQFNQLVNQCYAQYEDEKSAERLIHTEGAIYSLYVEILNTLVHTDLYQIVNFITEVDAIERSCCMDHYCYESFHSLDYRFEFPCRTSAIIVDILEKTLSGKKLNRGTAWLVQRILNERSAFLKTGYSDYHRKAENLLLFL